MCVLLPNNNEPAAASMGMRRKRVCFAMRYWDVRHNATAPAISSTSSSALSSSISLAPLPHLAALNAAP